MDLAGCPVRSRRNGAWVRSDAFFRWRERPGMQARRTQVGARMEDATSYRSSRVLVREKGLDAMIMPIRSVPERTMEDGRKGGKNFETGPSGHVVGIHRMHPIAHGSRYVAFHPWTHATVRSVRFQAIHVHVHLSSIHPSMLTGCIVWVRPRSFVTFPVFQDHGGWFRPPSLHRAISGSLSTHVLDAPTHAVDPPTPGSIPDQSGSASWHIGATPRGVRGGHVEDTSFHRGPCHVSSTAHPTRRVSTPRRSMPTYTCTHRRSSDRKALDGRHRRGDEGAPPRNTSDRDGARAKGDPRPKPTTPST